MKLILFAFLFVCAFNSNFAAPNIMEYRECKDRLETCHLVFKENKCQSSKYYQIYCCSSCSELKSKPQEVEDDESNFQVGEIDYNEFIPQQSDIESTAQESVDNDIEPTTQGGEDSYDVGEVSYDEVASEYSGWFKILGEIKISFWFMFSICTVKSQFVAALY